MRLFFLAIFAGLVLLSVAAWKSLPTHQGGKTVLLWVTDDNPFRREQYEPFNEMHSDVEVRLDPTNWGMEKVVVQSMGGVGPDLFDCYNTFEMGAYVRAGVAWDITDELARRGIDVKKETWKGVWPECIVQGRVYGFPTNAAVNGLWFHKDIFDAAGLEYPKGPWTWEQMVELAKKLTVRDGSGRILRYGFLCDWYVDYPQFIRQAGGRFYSADGTRCVADSPEAVAGIQFLQDLVFKYKVAPSLADELAMATEGGWGSGPITLFGGKRAAMALGGRWWLCTLRGYSGLRLGVAEPPHGKVRIFRGYGKATLVNKTSPRREEALKFLEYEDGRTYNELINAQADGVGPVMKYTETEQFLHNPNHPEEDYNDVWRDLMREAVADETSPFVNGPAVEKLVEKELDLIKGGQKTAEEGMHEIAGQINEQIQETIKKDAGLRKLYEERIKAAGK